MSTTRRRGLLGLATVTCAAAVASRTDTKAEARRECREERREHKAAFAKRFGGTGAKAMSRCVKHELNDRDRD